MTTSISLHSLLESHDQPFAIIDAALTIRGVNKAYESYFKQPRERLIGQPCCRVTGDDPPPEGCRHSRLFQELEPYRLTHTHETGGGASQSFQLRGFPLVGADRVIYLGESILPLALRRNTDGSNMVGQSALFKEMVKRLELAAGSLIPVLLQGETGTGKEVAAQYLHAHSLRADGPLVVVDCTVLGEELFESELFGHEKGAFTGASAQKKGLFELANGGTLFLDEVADLPLPMQVKLLRVLQEKKVRKLGAPHEDAVDVRIVCATHQNLARLAEAGRFRQDLYYRLNVIELAMPSLRERRDDIPGLARALLNRLGGENTQLAPEAERALVSYAYPGNVRELENILERALALCEDQRITAADLNLAPAQTAPSDSTGSKYPLQDYLDATERAVILEALEQTRHNKTAAARVLGVTFRSLRYRLERLGIE